MNPWEAILRQLRQIQAAKLNVDYLRTYWIPSTRPNARVIPMDVVVWSPRLGSLKLPLRWWSHTNLIRARTRTGLCREPMSASQFYARVLSGEPVHRE